MKAAATNAPMFAHATRSIDVAASHCERLSALSPSLFQTDRLSTYSLSVTGCCLRTNGRFAPEPDVRSAALLTRLGYWDQFARIRAEPRRWVVERAFACFGRHPSPRQRLRGSIHP